MVGRGGAWLVVVLVEPPRLRLFGSWWLPNRLRASTFVSRVPDQAPFPNDYGFLSIAEPCATARCEDV